MAQLSSPGVSVTLNDDSAYTTAPIGTVPLILVATAENRQNSAGTGIAPGTVKSDYGNVKLLTSQKDVNDVFGTPVFEIDSNNNPVHAGEQNEYGLQAAYSFLGSNNAAFVARADVDLAQLSPRTTIPDGTPGDNTFWFDTANTIWGIFVWDSAIQKLVSKMPDKVVTDLVDAIDSNAYGHKPNDKDGITGQIRVVAVNTLYAIWQKLPVGDSDHWVAIGSPEWVKRVPVLRSRNINDPAVTLFDTGETLTITYTNPDDGTTVADNFAAGTDSINDYYALVSAINSSVMLTDKVTATVTAAGYLEIFSAGGSIDFTGSTVSLLTKIGITAGKYLAPTLTIDSHIKLPEYDKKSTGTVNGRPSGSIFIQTTVPNRGADWSVKLYSTAASRWTSKAAPLYASNAAAIKSMDPTLGGIGIPYNSVYVKYNDAGSTDQVATFKVYRRLGGVTSIISKSITATTFTPGATYSFTVSESNTGTDTMSTPAAVSFTMPSTSMLASDIITLIIKKINDVLGTASNITVESTSDDKISIIHTTGGDIEFTDGTNSPISILFATNKHNFYNHPSGTTGQYIATMWTALNDANTGGFMIASKSAATSLTADGRLWYDNNVSSVDLLIHNGRTWVGLQYPGDDFHAKAPSPYYSSVEELRTDPDGPIISATKPYAQTDNTPLMHGDIWIDTSDREACSIYRYSDMLTEWEKLDTSDQTTSNGVLFHDARWAINGQSSEPSPIVELLASDYLDPDAPDPALYPKGMILWNLRRSGNNVKRFKKNYINIYDRNVRYNNEAMSTAGFEYYPHRWVSEAANRIDGSGTFGRKAQRAVVVQALQKLVNTNQPMRDPGSRQFNLIACPGYPELVDEMVNLNTDRGLTAFIIADTPSRLKPDATTLLSWGKNEAKAVESGDDGLVTGDTCTAYYYPWGYSSDNLGNNIAVPPSHMMLKTMAESDRQSQQWFAPAGMKRGIIANASNVGYITSEGEFKAVELNTGQRDTLAAIKVNCITTLAGSNLVAFSQFTKTSNSTAMDRINVSRLVCYLRRQFLVLGRPYLFEPNDSTTRTAIKRQADNLLTTLAGKRALYDFVTQCDNSNNTPFTIDRSELHLDIAISPMKSVEFIYIPLRLKNTGAK